MPEILVGQETQVVSQELYDELLKTYAGNDSNEYCAAFGSVGCGCTRHPHCVGPHVAHGVDGLGNVTVIAIWFAARPLHAPCADPERGEHAPEGW